MTRSDGSGEKRLNERRPFTIGREIITETRVNGVRPALDPGKFEIFGARAHIRTGTSRAHRAH